jgi:hypothetical protein
LGRDCWELGREPSGARGRRRKTASRRSKSSGAHHGHRYREAIFVRRLQTQTPRDVNREHRKDRACRPERASSAARCAGYSNSADTLGELRSEARQVGDNASVRATPVPKASALAHVARRLRKIVRVCAHLTRFDSPRSELPRKFSGKGLDSSRGPRLAVAAEDAHRQGLAVLGCAGMDEGHEGNHLPVRPGLSKESLSVASICRGQGRSRRRGSSCSAIVPPLPSLATIKYRPFA